MKPEEIKALRKLGYKHPVALKAAEELERLERNQEHLWTALLAVSRFFKGNPYPTTGGDDG